MTVTLMLAAAVAFAVVCGANDGATLVAAGLKASSIRPFSAIALISAAVMVGPLTMGTSVATTLAERLVGFEGGAGRSASTVAVLAAIAVAAGLSWRGLPTSLTLALIGAIAGSGLGYGLAVSWETVSVVLLAGIGAPLSGAVGGYLSCKLVLKSIPGRANVATRLGRLHALAFGLLCLAYSVNDGQKMLAVFAVAAGAGGTVAVAPWTLLMIGGSFALGTAFSVHRLAASLSTDVVLARPAHAVAAEFSSAVAVLGSGTFGIPVSMTQSLAAALVGSGMSEGYGKVRWRAASRIVLAWVLTFPIALAAALAVACATEAFQ